MKQSSYYLQKEAAVYKSIYSNKKRL